MVEFYIIYLKTKLFENLSVMGKCVLEHTSVSRWFRKKFCSVICCSFLNFLTISAVVGISHGNSCNTLSVWFSLNNSFLTRKFSLYILRRIFKFCSSFRIAFLILGFGREFRSAFGIGLKAAFLWGWGLLYRWSEMVNLWKYYFRCNQHI